MDALTDYPGIDAYSLAIAEIQGHIDAGHLFATIFLYEVRAKLRGADPILNKIGIIYKICAGKIRRRMILDTKRPESSLALPNARGLYCRDC